MPDDQLVVRGTRSGAKDGVCGVGELDAEAARSVLAPGSWLGAMEHLGVGVEILIAGKLAQDCNGVGLRSKFTSRAGSLVVAASSS